jgi:hypothetical protein
MKSKSGTIIAEISLSIVMIIAGLFVAFTIYGDSIKAMMAPFHQSDNYNISMTSTGLEQP